MRGATSSWRRPSPGQIAADARRRAKPKAVEGECPYYCDGATDPARYVKCEPGRGAACDTCERRTDMTRGAQTKAPEITLYIPPPEVHREAVLRFAAYAAKGPGTTRDTICIQCPACRAFDAPTTLVEQPELLKRMGRQEIAGFDCLRCHTHFKCERWEARGMIVSWQPRGARSAP